MFRIWRKYGPLMVAPPPRKALSLAIPKATGVSSVKVRLVQKEATEGDTEPRSYFKVDNQAGPDISADSDSGLFILPNAGEGTGVNTRTLFVFGSSAARIGLYMDCKFRIWRRYGANRCVPTPEGLSLIHI